MPFTTYLSSRIIIKHIFGHNDLSIKRYAKKFSFKKLKRSIQIRSNRFTTFPNDIF